MTREQDMIIQLHSSINCFNIESSTILPALLINTSSWPKPRTNLRAHSRTESRLARSSNRKWTSASGTARRRFATTASVLALFRHARTTRAPLVAHSAATAVPMPADAPECRRQEIKAKMDDESFTYTRLKSVWDYVILYGLLTGSGLNKTIVHMQQAFIDHVVLCFIQHETKCAVL